MIFNKANTAFYPIRR